MPKDETKQMLENVCSYLNNLVLTNHDDTSQVLTAVEGLRDDISELAAAIREQSELIKMQLGINNNGMKR